MIAFGNAIHETCTAPGVSDFVVTGAASSFQTWASGLTDGAKVYYEADDTIANGTDREVGEGVWDETNLTVERTTVLWSTNGGTSKVNFSNDVRVRLTVAAEWFSDPTCDSLGVGTETPDALVEFLDASGAQLRLTHTDATKFVDFTLDTNHDLLIKPSSTGQIKLQPTTNSTDFLEVLDAAGASAMWFDTTNRDLTIQSAVAGSGQAALYLREASLYSVLAWDAGANVFKIDVDLGAGARERLQIGSGSVVINDDGDDCDFRVESNNNTHMLFVDAGNDLVGVNVGSSPDGVLHAAHTDYASTVLCERTGATTDDPYYALRVLGTKSTNMAAGFGTGIRFAIQDNAGVENPIASVGAVREVVDNSGAFVVHTYSAGSASEKVRVTSGGLFGVGKTPGKLIDAEADAGAIRVKNTSGSIAIRDVGLFYGGANADDSGSRVILGGANDESWAAVGGIRRGGDKGFEVFVGTSLTSAMRITSTGNIGVHTNSPGYDIDVRPSATSNAELFLGESSTLGARVGWLGNDNEFVIQYHHGVAWEDRLRIGTAETVFNEGSQNVDFRVEGNNNANTFFVDAGNDRVGILTNLPAEALEIAGNLRFGNAANRTISITQTATDTDGRHLTIAAGAAGLGGPSHHGGDLNLNAGTGWFGFAGVEGGDVNIRAGSNTGVAQNWGGVINFITGGNDVGQSTRARITKTGEMGVNALTPDGILHAAHGTGTSTAIFERSGQTSDAVYTAARLGATKTTNMADGFGVQLSFAIQDNAGGWNYLATVGAERAGADNTGDFLIYTATAGSFTEKVRVTSAGHLTFESPDTLNFNIHRHLNIQLDKDNDQSGETFTVKMGSGTVLLQVDTTGVLSVNNGSAKLQAGEVSLGANDGLTFNDTTNVFSLKADGSARAGHLDGGVLSAGSWLELLERSADPTQPAEGETVIWMSDGTGKGDDGDVLIAGTAGGTTKWDTLFDHSAGAAW